MPHRLLPNVAESLLNLQSTTATSSNKLLKDDNTISKSEQTITSEKTTICACTSSTCAISTNNNSKKMVSRPTKEKIYTREKLDAFNLLEHPVWVFDIERTEMYWANESALEVWNADSLESLLSRSFADDMSEATEQRLNEYLVHFRKGESIQDQWTYYPKGKATTVRLTMSGIRIEDGRLAMLNEGVLPMCKEEIDKESLRGVEMLRHLPVAVCQFDLTGRIMYQNPESLNLFGPVDEAQFDPDEQLQNKDELSCTFLSRFGDKILGNRALEAISMGAKDYNVEAQQITKHGMRWFSISLRRSKDPVSSNPIILYSARDVTEVVEAKKQADRANSEKSEFLAVMAHEIRTPLHQVIGFVELLSQTQLAKQQSEYVSLMQSSSMGLMSIINDLLEISKIEAGKLKLESIPFEVKGVLDGCRQSIEPKVVEKGLLLKCSVPVGLPVKLLGDPNRLRQILLNLLQNSVKFTHTGGLKLAVSNVQEEEGGKVRIRFEVEDSGIGISEDQQELIFGKYQQSNASIARSYGGTGLGLSICKSLVESMGGTIGLESRIGHGTKVTFEIPFVAATKPPDTVESKLEAVKDNKSLYVLVVEDNKMNQKVVKAMLQRMGHTVALAENGAIGVEMIEKEQFDAVLMDVQMPVMDGIEATKLIRSKGICEASLPVIGLTASYQTADQQYYRDIGMNDCIGKPVRIKTLKKVLSDMHSGKPADDICPCVEKIADPKLLVHKEELYITEKLSITTDHSSKEALSSDAAKKTLQRGT